MNMTVYDMVYEEDQSDIYNILLNPNVVVDPLQNGILPGIKVYSFTFMSVISRSFLTVLVIMIHKNDRRICQNQVGHNKLFPSQFLVTI